MALFVGLERITTMKMRGGITRVWNGERDKGDRMYDVKTSRDEMRKRGIPDDPNHDTLYGLWHPEGKPDDKLPTQKVTGSKHT